MRMPGETTSLNGPGEMARLAAIARVAMAKGWGESLFDLRHQSGGSAILISGDAGLLGLAWAILALRSGKL